MPRPRGRLGYALGGVALVLVVGGSCALAGVVLLAWAVWPKVQEHYPTPAPRADPAAFRETLGRVHAAVPEPEGLAARPCPDAEILARAGRFATTGLQGQALLPIPQVSYDALGVYARRGPTQHDRPGGAWPTAREDFGFDPAPATGPDDWLWLEDFALRRLFHPNLRDGAAAAPDEGAREEDRTIRETVDRRYLAVLRARQRAMPKTRTKGEDLGGLRTRRRALTRGQSFDPGVFHGAVVVMDLASAAAVCQAPVDAESAQELEYTARGPFKSRPSDVVRDDFQDRLRRAARDALAAQSRLLELR
jgi:hypothetical protein